MLRCISGHFFDPPGVAVKTALMTDKQKVRIGRKLSLVLRHQPEAIGLTLDKHGWADVNKLLRLMNASGTRLTREQLVDIVETNDKQRYSFDAHGQRIRANQGHSLTGVDLQLEAATPPSQLYHGTATRFLESILAEGIQKRSRQHVHLSPDVDTATQVGGRHGKVVVMTIDSGRMAADGVVFTGR